MWKLCAAYWCWNSNFSKKEAPNCHHRWRERTVTLKRYWVSSAPCIIILFMNNLTVDNCYHWFYYLTIDLVLEITLNLSWNLVQPVWNSCFSRELHVGWLSIAKTAYVVSLLKLIQINAVTFACEWGLRYTTSQLQIIHWGCSAFFSSWENLCETIVHSTLE